MYVCMNTAILAVQIDCVESSWVSFVMAIVDFRLGVHRKNNETTFGLVEDETTAVVAVQPE